LPPSPVHCLFTLLFPLLSSYGIVAAYALADTMDRGFKAYWQTQASPLKPKSTASARPVAHRRQPLKVLAAAPAPKMEQQRLFTPVSATVVDSLLWHGAASLVLPFVVINRQAI
jgi:Mitochondrial 18 KDa protein (MTP18)